MLQYNNYANTRMGEEETITRGLLDKWWGTEMFLNQSGERSNHSGRANFAESPAGSVAVLYNMSWSVVLTIGKL